MTISLVFAMHPFPLSSESLYPVASELGVCFSAPLTPNLSSAVVYVMLPIFSLIEGVSRTHIFVSGLFQSRDERSIMSSVSSV